MLGRMESSPEKQLPKGLYWKRESIWVFVGRHGQKHHKPAHTVSIKAALEVRDQLLKEVIAGEKTVAGVGNITCAQLIENYLDRLKRTAREDTDTPESTRRTVEKHLIPVFGKTKATRVSREMLEKYRDEKIALGYSQVTVNRQLGYLRTAFRRGQKDKLVNQVPDFSTTIFASAERENARQGIITEGQYHELLKHITVPFFRALFILCWNTGVRPKEAFRLKWSQVDWEKRLIGVTAKQAKIGIGRYLPMRQVVADAMNEWRTYLLDLQPKAEYIFTHPMRGDRMTKSDYRSPWERTCLRAGYGEMVAPSTGTSRNYIKTSLLFYDARRAFRTYMPEEINATDGKMVMGHTEDTTFGRYMVEPQKAASRMLKAMEKEQPKANGNDDKKTRLAELKDWFDSGLIDADEYKEQKRGVMSGSL
jgi:integrase